MIANSQVKGTSTNLLVARCWRPFDKKVCVLFKEAVSQMSRRLNFPSSFKEAPINRAQKCAINCEILLVCLTTISVVSNWSWSSCGTAMCLDTSKMKLGGKRQDERSNCHVCGIERRAQGICEKNRDRFQFINPSGSGSTGICESCRSQSEIDEAWCCS